MKPHHLGSGKDGVRQSRRVGDDDSWQPVFGHHACCVKRIGVDGYDRKLFDDVFGVHVHLSGSVRPIADQTSRHT